MDIETLRKVCDMLDLMGKLDIRDCNSGYQYSVYDKILASGRKVGDFTISEMSNLLDEANNEFYS